MAALLVALPALAAVPFGYRYVGSRLVSEGRVVYWYWNVDYVELGPQGTSFVARLYARAVDVNQERPFVALVRCDTRAYRELGSSEPFDAIEPGEPIDAVWRAGCGSGRAVPLAQRYAQLGGEKLPPMAALAPPPVPAPAARPAEPAPPPPPPPQMKPVADTKDVADPKRADACLRFAESTSSPTGDATISNTCAFPIEVTLCYKGGGRGIYDCPQPPKGRRADSLGPGVTHRLPEYSRARNRGIASIACRGTLGSVFPTLDDTAGTTGCR